MSISNDTELNLNLLNRTIVKRWKRLVTSIFLFVLCGLIYSLSIPNVYKSSATLVPNMTEDEQGIGGGLSGQFGGIASLAGLQLDSNKVDTVTIALTVIQSFEFLSKFINEHDFEPELVAAVEWERNNNSIKYDEVLFDNKNRKWLLSAQSEQRPSMQETVDKFLKENFTISQDKSTGLITLEIFHVSPIIAKKILDQIIVDLNAQFKAERVAQARERIIYLENKISGLENKRAITMFYGLIERNYQTLFLSESKSDFVFKVIEKGLVEEKKVKPKRSVIVILFAIMGLVFGTIWASFPYFRST